MGAWSMNLVKLIISLHMSKFPCIDGLTKIGFRSFTLHFVETFKLVSDGISLGSKSSHCSFNDKKMVHFMKSSFVM